MTVLARLVVLALGTVGIGLTGGCTSRSGGVVQESDEFSFDDIAAAAAAEAEQSENDPQ